MPGEDQKQKHEEYLKQPLSPLDLRTALSNMLLICQHLLYTQNSLIEKLTHLRVSEKDYQAYDEYLRQYEDTAARMDTVADIVFGKGDD